MNRQRLAQLRIAPLHLQQGLFAVLALLVTLIAGQQFQRWQDSQAPEPRVPVHHFTQTHFSSVSSQLNEQAPMQLMAVDQAQPVVDAPRQERWVFYAQLLDHGQGQGVQGFFRVQGGNGDACTIGAGEFFDVQVHRDLDGKFKRSV